MKNLLLKYFKKKEDDLLLPDSCGQLSKSGPFYSISATNAKVKAVMEDMNEDTVGTTKFYYEIFNNSIST